MAQHTGRQDMVCPKKLEKSCRSVVACIESCGCCVRKEKLELEDTATCCGCTAICFLLNYMAKLEKPQACCCYWAQQTQLESWYAIAVDAESMHIQQYPDCHCDCECIEAQLERLRAL